MTVKFKCEGCGQKLSTDSEKSGSVAPCPKCGASVTLPRHRLSRLVFLAPIACLILGAAVIIPIHHYRKGMRKSEHSDLSEAEIARMRKAAEMGDAAAQCKLGHWYFYEHHLGPSTPSYQKEAAIWWRKAAEQENSEAQYHLGECYDRGEGVGKDEAEAVKWYIKAAEGGDVTAQRKLGGYYGRDGPVPARNGFESVKWYRKAAEQGDEDAQEKLGECYAYGIGMPSDQAEAINWFSRAAEQGNSDAQIHLAERYHFGYGVPKNEAEALKWFRKAAEQGEPLAQEFLERGTLETYTRNGESYMFDAEELKRTQEKARQGDMIAQELLGDAYAEGWGCSRFHRERHGDRVEAANWWRKAAEQGDSEAQYHLGECYAFGLGVPKDDLAAYMWFNLSAAHRNPDASHYREIVEKRMTPDQITEAQRMSREWKPK